MSGSCCLFLDFFFLSGSGLTGCWRLLPLAFVVFCMGLFCLGKERKGREGKERVVDWRRSLTHWVRCVGVINVYTTTWGRRCVTSAAFVYPGR